MCILHCIPFYYLVLLMSMWEVYKKDFADSTVVSLKKKRKIMAATVEKNRAMLDCSCSRKEQCVWSMSKLSTTSNAMWPLAGAGRPSHGSLCERKGRVHLKVAPGLYRHLDGDA